MRDQEIYSKTESGRLEIETRANKLPPSMRSVLLVVDGVRDVGQLRGLATRLHAPPDALELLAGSGLIATGADAAAASNGVPASDTGNRYRMLSGLMSEAVRQHLGLRGYFMQLKIERCGNIAELSALLSELAATVAKQKGGPYASEWEEGVRAAAAVQP